MIAENQIIGAGKPQDPHVDLRRALRTLQTEFPPDRPPQGYILGRTQMRNALAETTGCSLLHAEDLIMNLINQNLVRYDGHPMRLETAPSYWTIEQ